MKTMKIYEPAMCCPTGICGVGVDPELLHISTVLNTLDPFEVTKTKYLFFPGQGDKLLEL